MVQTSPDQGETSAAAGTNAGEADANADARSGAISSGMPVPGTNTPEHVVVNDDSPGESNQD